MKDIYTGYESKIDMLKTYTKEDYLKMDNEERIGVQEEVLKIYREINLFPIYKYSEEGIKKEIIKCLNKEVALKEGTLDIKFNQGSSLCKHLFPNLHKVDCKGVTKNSMYDRFFDDHKMKRAIDFALRFKKSVTPSEIRTSLEMIGGNVATNFPAMKAKAIFEKYTPENGTIYDYSCGFGGRLLGALSSKNNYSYIGTEPNTETYENLNTLGKHIERATNTKNRFNIICQGSEEDTGFRDVADFAFSSPPYFTLERYCDEETQCYIKYDTLEKWFEGYVRPTIRNIYNILKGNRFYAVNIADFNIGKNRVEFVEEWIKISKEEGFTFCEKIDMKLTARKGNGHSDDKKEGIYVFYKAF